MEFPRQNIPESKKDEEWYRNNVDAILSYHNDNEGFIDSRLKDHENYLLVHGHFDHKQFEYITDTYGITAPARLVNYPIIMPKLDLLAGELVSQPLQFTVNVVNRNAIRRKNEKRIQVATETILRPIRREIEKAIGMKMPDEDVGMEVPPDVEQYQKMKFRDHVESMVNTGLNYCIQKYDLKQVFKRGFYDLGITSKEFYRVYIKNNDPYCERLDPRSVFYDPDTDKETLQDAKYAGVENWYTINELLDQYPGLTDDQVEEIEDLAKNDGQWYDQNNSIFDSYVYSEGNNLKVRVVDVQWKGLTTMKYKVSPNKYDPNIDYYKKVKDTYKGSKNEKVVKKTRTNVYKAVKVGHELLIDFGPKPNQIRFEDNYSNTTLDFYGVIKNNFNGTTLSVVDSLKNIQILYNIVIYQIELAMARSGGKAMVYDVSQKPKKMPIEDVMYHAKNSGLVLINSKQEGMNSFNQFGEIDFTLSQSVSQMINLKIMLEDTADKLTGISAARSGITKSGDLVGVTERNVMQSTLITAPLFDIHYKVVGDVLQGMANLMKIAWGEEGRMINVFGDMGMQTFKIDKSIGLDEIGLFIENSGKSVQRRQEMMMLLDRFSSSGNIDPLSVISAVNADSAVEVEAILRQGLEGVKAAAEELEERKVAAQEAANEIQDKKNTVVVDVAKIKAAADIEVQKLKNSGEASRQSAELEHKEDMQDIQSKSNLDQEMLRASNSKLEEMEEESTSAVEN